MSPWPSITILNGEGIFGLCGRCIALYHKIALENPFFSWSLAITPATCSLSLKLTGLFLLREGCYWQASRDIHEKY